MYGRVATGLVVAAAIAAALDWSPIAPTAGKYACATVDRANRRVLIFGGSPSGSSGSNDVWEIPLDTVTGYRFGRLEPTGTRPAPRWGASAVYDSASNRMLIFGGEANSTRFADVWALDLTPGSESWSEVTAGGTPPTARRGAYVVYHDTREELIVFGGIDSRDMYMNDAWTLSVGCPLPEWQELSPTGSPPDARCDGACCWDATEDRLVLFGGRGPETFYADVWALGLDSAYESWTRLSPQGTAPSRRAGHSSGYSPDSRELFVFGGYDYVGGHYFYNDAYILDLATETWARIGSGGQDPAPRRNAPGWFDPFNARVGIYGGDDYYTWFSDAWFARYDYVGMSEWSLAPGAGPGLLLQPVVPSVGNVRIRYALPGASHGSLRVVDVTGRLVRVLDPGLAGTGWLAWDRTDDSGRAVAAGTYYCILETGDVGLSRKLVLAE